MEEIDKEFIEGFNQGYFLKGYESSLADSLAKVEDESMRIKGIRYGIKQCQLEKELYPSWFNNISKSLSDSKESPPEKDMDLEKD